MNPLTLQRKFASAVAGFEFRADPLEAELLATFLLEALTRNLDTTGPRFDQAIIDTAIPGIASVASPKSLAVLRAIATLTRGKPAIAAATAADRLLAAGVPIPAWVAELSERTTVSGCTSITGPQRDITFLLAAFHRAGRSHLLVTQVDHRHGGTAVDITLADATRVGDFLDQLKSETPTLVATRLSTNAFRAQAESVLAIRAALDRAELEQDFALGAVAQEHYRAMARLLRTRLNTLPLPPLPVRCEAPRLRSGVRRGGRARIDSLPSRRGI